MARRSVPQNDQADDPEADGSQDVPPVAEAVEVEPLAPQRDAPSPDKSEQPDPESGDRPKPGDRRREIVEALKAKKEAEEAALDAERPPEASSEPPPEKRIKLKVDRKEVELTETERNKAAQMHLAEEGRLTELNQLRSQLKAELAHLSQLRNTPQQRESAAPPPPNQAPTGQGAFSPQELRALVEKIQLGDADEGAAAMATLFSRVPQQPTYSPEDIATRATEVYRAQEAAHKAATDFRDKHPLIAESPGMQFETAAHIHPLCVEEMRNVRHPQTGMPMSQEHIQQAEANPETAVMYHRNLRLQGYPLSGWEDVSENAAARVEQTYRQRFGTPQQSQPSAGGQSRLNEKRATLAQQPRRVNAIDRQPATPPKATRTSVVDKMRKARGLPIF